MQLPTLDWRQRLRAAGIHLSISVAMAAVSALLVFVVWYPYPYREISGGRELFTLVVVVDVLLGPLITFFIFDQRKPWTELRRDLAFVGLIQLAALAYGIWSVGLARPVHLVFEIDRFRVVHAVEVAPELLDKAPQQYRSLPYAGPTLLSVRPFKDAKEGMEATMAALQGLQLGARPDLWQPYDLAHTEVRKVARPLSDLQTRFPKQHSEIDRMIMRLRLPAEQLVYVPLVGRKSFWTVVLDSATLQILDFLPLDSF